MLVGFAPTEATAQTNLPDPTDQTVFSDSPLIPDTSLNVGDKFRLLFVTSTNINGGSNNLDTYNTLVQNAANNGHADIRVFSDQFRALVSILGLDTARRNTDTVGTSSPIYWLLGAKSQSITVISTMAAGTAS